MQAVITCTRQLNILKILLVFFAAIPVAWSQTAARSTACINPTGDFTYTINDKSVSFANGVSNATTWKWDFGDGLTSTSKDPSHNYASYGKFNVCLTAFSDCSQALFCNTITVSEPIVTAVESIPENLIYVFPNPVNKELFAHFDREIPHRVSVVTILGERVISLESTEIEAAIQLDLSKLAAGIYFLVCESPGTVYFRKIIKVN